MTSGISPGAERTPRFSTSVSANTRLRELVDRGARVLPLLVDRPTESGLDSDAPFAFGHVGRAGVAVDSIDDMRVLLSGIPLDRVSLSLEVDAAAAPLILLYELVAEEHGVPAARLRGSVRGDVLKEFIAPGGTCLFPPAPSMRLTRDVLRYCRTSLPRWNVLSVCGHDLAEAGADPAQEVAFTLANGIAYVRTAVSAGMNADTFVPGLTFCLSDGDSQSEVLAKFRAARRIWTRAMNEQFGPDRAGRTVLRLGGPAPRITPSPGGGRPWRRADASREIEAAAVALMDSIERLGGAVRAVERRFQRTVLPREGRPPGPYGGQAPCPEARAAHRGQGERLAKLRAWRVQSSVDDALARLEEAARGNDNVMFPMRSALAASATVGEICRTLRGVWGTYPPRGAHP
ncbi:methylmalonyl-CoA mutase family protein [Streptomyces sp. NPDC048507]|uniref:methylmalonyl-CoA mutase family protein n=1 Tax=Streptomyces sp. NPDC048507 TaxID=3365560 RepID=UPI003712C2BE